MAHTFINISFEDPDAGATAVTIDGDEFTPDGWSIVTNTNSAEETADFGASAGLFTERAERFEAHWTGLSSYVFAYEAPDNPSEILTAQFNTGINATSFEGFEREWSSNESYLFGLGASSSAAFDPSPESFEDFEEEWSNSNYAFDISGIATSLAAFDPVTGPENFEDYEEEWSDNHNYDLVMGSTTAALFEVANPEDSFEFTDFTQWTVTVVTATAGGSYTVTIDGEDHTHIAGGAPTLTTIRDGLVTAIAAGSKPVVTDNPDTTRFTLARDPAIQEPPRNRVLALTVKGPVTGDLTKLATDKSLRWTQTGQTAIDP